MRGRHTFTVPAVDLYTNSTITFPSRAAMQKSTSDVLVIYSITAAFRCGAAAADHGLNINDGITGEVYVELASTFAANAYDTLHLTFDKGLPILLQITAMSSAAPTGGYVTIVFDYVPASALR
jgi:hypothetical protein